MTKHSFDTEEVSLFIQWFNFYQDTNHIALDENDYVLAEKLLNILRLRIPNSVKGRK